MITYMNDIKVSVIIPAYNCEKVVGDTIKSVLNQKLTEFEVILLNDGSTDNTLSVLEKLTKHDNRVKIITLKNGGPAKARNLGITQAVGKYIYFLDSDDTIHEDMLFDMYDLAQKNSLDICACGYTMDNLESGTKKDFLHTSFVARDKEAFRAELMSLIKDHLMYVVWNKLFNRMFILENHINFTDFLSGEDRLFNIQCFKFVERFGFINKPYYQYFLRGQASLANKYISNRFEATLKAHLDLTRAYKDMGIYTHKNKSYLDFVFVKGIMACFCQMFLKACPLSKKQKLSYIKSTLDMPWVIDAISSYDDEIAYSKHINKILRGGNINLIYLTAKTIYVMQTRFSGLYHGIKHKHK